MDFGNLPHEQLATINFTLPPDPIWNREALTGVRTEGAQVYVGCPRWSVKEWVGDLYPKGTKAADYLTEYAKQFSCIELNATYHHLHNADDVRKWKAQVAGRRFKFCPKVFKGISHEGTLDDKDDLTGHFMDSMLAFEEHLGPMFIQLSDYYSPQRRNELIDYIQALPTDIDFFIELRHPDWFLPDELSAIASILRTQNKGLVITDVAGRRDVLHMGLTVPKTLIRFNAYNNHPTNEQRLQQWVGRIQQWLEKGLQELYFIIHLHQEIYAPAVVTSFINMLNKEAGLSLQAPKPVQPSLF